MPPKGSYEYARSPADNVLQEPIGCLALILAVVDALKKAVFTLDFRRCDPSFSLSSHDPAGRSRLSST